MKVNFTIFFAADLVPVNENCTFAELMKHHQLTEDDCSGYVVHSFIFDLPVNE